MASYQPFHDKASSDEDLPLVSEEDYDETPKAKRPRRLRTSTLLLSLSTLIFGAHSLYTLLRPTRYDLSSFSQGYKTDWGTLRRVLFLEESSVDIGL